MKAITTTLALIAVGGLAVPALASVRTHHPRSTAAIPAPPGSVMKGLGAPTDYLTGFEAGEGFTAGLIIDGQAGWTQFLTSTDQPTVADENPANGDQHLRVALDPAVAQGSFVGGFSPDLALGVTPGNLTSELSVMMSISDIGGADYTIVPQSPDQGLLAARVIFSFTGTVAILDEIGGVLEFIDTGFAYPVGAYFRVTIRLDNQANTIDYFINDAPGAAGDGTLVYTSEGGVFAGTSMDQVVLFSDNFGITDSGDWDDLNIVNSFEIACPEDLDESGDVGFADLLRVLARWGQAGGPEDLDEDGTVGFGDLLRILANWGVCN
ncbi:MAG: hypothetical protein HKO59_10780 [Phycisphaerales bacterium]|nr:hypothetical protein [Phycisphaerae bacterium]NNF42105.1 hypothetical protein [Phycisphaerales bacterium]NNM26448.1 hypothetical protein [Phycisphaerales bacterium]